MIVNLQVAGFYKAFLKNGPENMVTFKGPVDIGTEAFIENNFKDLKLQEGTSIGSRAFMKNKLTELTIPPVKRIGQSAFQENKLTTLILESVTSIEEYAFFENQLTKVLIPKTVKTIEEYAFGKNPGLRTFAFVNSPNESTANVEIIQNPNNEKITVEERAFPKAIMEVIGNEESIELYIESDLELEHIVLTPSGGLGFGFPLAWEDLG